MTLQQRFKQWLDTDPRYQIRDVQLEVIAEDFAIGFGQWLIKKEHEYTNKIIAMEELLEIYKKERGL